MSCCLILFALLSAKQYLLTGSIIYKKWTSPEGTGLVMSGWQALGVLFGEAAIGVYGLMLVLKNKPTKSINCKKSKENEN